MKFTAGFFSTMVPLCFVFLSYAWLVHRSGRKNPLKEQPWFFVGLTVILSCGGGCSFLFNI